MSRRKYAIRQTIATGLALLAALFIIAHCSGCREFIPAADDPDLAHLNAVLSKCRDEARKAKAAGRTSASAYMVYEDCKRREHVEGVYQ
jgi:hypothetical protein